MGITGERVAHASCTIPATSGAFALPIPARDVRRSARADASAAAINSAIRTAHRRQGVSLQSIACVDPSTLASPPPRVRTSRCGTDRLGLTRGDRREPSRQFCKRARPLGFEASRRHKRRQRFARRWHERESVCLRGQLDSNGRSPGHEVRGRACPEFCGLRRSGSRRPGWPLARVIEPRAIARTPPDRLPVSAQIVTAGAVGGALTDDSVPRAATARDDQIEISHTPRRAARSDHTRRLVRGVPPEDARYGRVPVVCNTASTRSARRS